LHRFSPNVTNEPRWWRLESELSRLDQDSLLYQIKWKGHSRLLHKWSELKVQVYIDFGGPFLWRLLGFDPSKRIGTVKLVTKKGLEIYIKKKAKAVMTLKIDPRMKKALEELADKQFISISAAVKQAIDKHLKENGIDWREKE
jgi:hypothetical protein